MCLSRARNEKIIPKDTLTKDNSFTRDGRRECVRNLPVLVRYIHMECSEDHNQFILVGLCLL